MLQVDKEERGLFVRRRTYLSDLSQIIGSEGGGMAVVEGRAGIGKTSFVNAVQYDKWNKKHTLPPFSVFQVQKGTYPVDFVLSALSTCIGSLDRVAPGKGDKHRELRAGKTMVSQMVNAGWCLSVGASVGIIGGSAGCSRTAAQSSPLLPALPSILETSRK